MDFNEDTPLGQAFYSNPHEFFQNYVRNMNNELFLSQYQINNLYALLLIGRASPWDSIKPDSPNFKQEVDVLIQKKIKDVKFLLDNLSQLYEQKVKKTTFNQIQKLMSIIKAKNKSIFIEKEFNEEDAKRLNLHLKQRKDHKNIQSHPNNHQQQQSMSKQHSQQICSLQHNQNSPSERMEQSVQTPQKQQSAQLNYSCQFHGEQTDDREVFGIFAGLANLPNLSALALSNCLEYNASERYIKFKMSRNYIMTIKNNDSVSYDLTSSLRNVPPAMFTNHIFPYLTALELFRVRQVCKEWLTFVKDSWHSTFKRQMYIQLLAGEFCKDIQFFYKCIQLRNPFFHKLSLLLHALIEIIQWETVVEATASNTINLPLKRVILVLMKLLGDKIEFQTINQLNQPQLWQQNKSKVAGLKQRVSQFFSTLSGSGMSITELRHLKTQILDHPFMRGDEMQSEQKTPLLLLIFIKQLALQQILKNHLYFSQEYLMNSKSRLDVLSMKMPQQKGFLEGVYKVLLLKAVSPREQEDLQEDKTQMPNFQQMIQSIFENKDSDLPDFSFKTRSSKTQIYLDRATKLDIIISTVRKVQDSDPDPHQPDLPQQTQEFQHHCIHQIPPKNPNQNQEQDQQKGNDPNQQSQ